MLLAKKEKMLFDCILEADYNLIKEKILDLPSLDFFNDQGESPLAVACYEVEDDHIQDILYLMLSKGAKINAFQGTGYTPLFNATLALRPFLVELLLKNGADPNINFFEKDFPEVISSALDFTYLRMLEASIMKFEGNNTLKSNKELDLEIKGCTQIMHLMSKFGAKLKSEEIIPYLS